MRSLGLLLLFTTVLNAQETPTEEMPVPDSVMLNAYLVYLDSLEGTLNYYQDTTIDLGDGLALLEVPAGYRYLDPDDAFTVLVNIWGNPPSSSESTMGMLFPADAGPLDQGAYGIDIFYTEDGYIEDDDAEDMDYDELLEQMQADIQAGNEERVAAGYESMELVNWASPPYYDAANKRLHWAKELYFEGADANTLNYNVLFLGRKGYLTMNAIGGMEDLEKVSAGLPGFLNSVSYQEGHRYADFDPSVDEVAAYGIGALIAGKVLAKTGILAGIGIFLLKAWKLVLVGLVALGAGLKKLIGK